MNKFQILNKNIIQSRENPDLPIYEKLKNIKFIIKPERKKPNLDIPQARQDLAVLTNERDFDFNNPSDIDRALKSMHNLSQENYNKLRQYITPATDVFSLSVKSVIEEESGIFVVSFENRRIPIAGDSLLPNEYFESLSIVYNSNTKTLSIRNFYPVNATIRGYSIGGILINKLERYAKVFGAKTIIIENPTQDGMGFYRKQGFDNDGVKLI